VEGVDRQGDRFFEREDATLNHRAEAITFFTIRDLER
jgi:hypothetical protein